MASFFGGASFSSSAVGRDRIQYIVDGLALGDSVAPLSSTYKAYKCRPSEQFAAFVWCQRRRAESGKFGEFSSVNSILHAPNGETAYISRFIEPAYFAKGDIAREFDRLSQRFEISPHVLRSPQRSGNPSGIIAYWGDVTLTPLDGQSLAQLAAGRSVVKGLLFDFLGNFGDSARAGLPIYQLGGGPGYVWGAHYDESGRGALRITAIDASRFAPPPVIARREFDTPTPPPPVTGRSIGMDSRPMPSPNSGGVWTGTGFFVSKEGHVVTNYHVIENCRSIVVITGTAERIEAREIAKDATNDLALLSTGLRPGRVAAPRLGTRLGEYVAAFGYPHADLLASSGNFTQGSISALAGMGDDTRFLQITTPVQAGNSGGPLLDGSGNLVGIVTSKLNALKIAQASGDFPQNVNFALKASIVASFLDTNGIKYGSVSTSPNIKPEDLADQAKAMSVFVMCQ